ncbi:MAG: hypothetical protein R3266_11380, partial [Gemmatimonadota bacterium]|nr:hypothetical protein [Gemmatimonadota bacterium]
MQGTSHESAPEAGDRPGSGDAAPLGRASRIRSRQLFFASWIVFTAHFATNIEREHYPAFALVERGNFQVDEYLGFHSDIFQHTDGHAYIGNNVAGAVIAAVPLFVFDPALDRLEAYSLRQLEEGDGTGFTEYRTYEHHPNRKAFFDLVRERGLELRFGGAAFVTTAFLMAPLSALFVALLFLLLRRRGVERGKATLLALLFGFGTPIFFRTAALNHNMFVMWATFGSFLLMWPRGERAAGVSLRNRILAGGLAGLALALDYAGVIPLLALYGYLVLDRARFVPFARSFRESLAFVAGSVPPVLFLLYSQWAMFGNPFLPGQYWMPEVNYTDEGWRGFSLPAPDLFFKNLFEPEYGLFTFGPILLLGFIPAWRYAKERLVFSRPERWFAFGFVLAFLLFCAANQYSRMQWNTGFRYLLPIVPFVFLAACDHLVRMPKWALGTIAALASFHSWVIATIREAVPLSYRI